MNLTELLTSSQPLPYQFPKKGFDILYKNGNLELPRFRHNSKIKDSSDETQIILQDLIEVGYSDLALGRIYEGHINALLLIDQFGTQAQKDKYFKEATEGKIFGIWNTESPAEAMTIQPTGKQTYELFGAKTFCSGGLNITRPIITAQNDEGKQMIILELESHPTLEEDKSFWKVMGMESTLSHRIDFSHIVVRKNQLIGGINDYDREPKISIGAIRFAAVQYGCAKSIAQIAIQHLNKTNRNNHPIQNARIAELGILVTKGQLWFNGYQNIRHQEDELHKNYVNMLRTDILRICESILSIAERAIGVQGFLKAHPLEKKYRDLKVYLKQPNPDWAIEKVGKYYSEHGFKH